jgi:hypothetical protein
MNAPYVEQKIWPQSIAHGDTGSISLELEVLKADIAGR